MHPCSALLTAAHAVSRFELLAERARELWDQPLAGVLLRVLFGLSAGALGVYLMLPRGQSSGRRRERYLGAGVATLSLVLLVTAPISPALREQVAAVSQPTIFWSLADQPAIAGVTFYILAVLSLASAIMMITSRNPVYSALWFAMVLLANSGLFLLQGAEFLSAATIIVYAGAILVTFLFVIMLAQPTGAAKYDRLSREPVLSSVTGLILASALVGTLHYSLRVEHAGVPSRSIVPPPGLIADVIADRGGEVARIEPGGHVAGLGRALFLDHLVSVEVIGVLLLVAVVGAMLIAGHRVEAASADSPSVDDRGWN